MAEAGPAAPTVARVYAIVGLTAFVWGVLILISGRATYGAIVEAVPLLLLGGVVPVLLGSSRMLLQGVFGVIVPNDPFRSWVPLLLTAGTSVAMHLRLGAGWYRDDWALVGWAAGVLVHVASVVQGVAGGRDPGRRSPLDGFLLSSVAYAVVACVALVFRGRVGLAMPEFVHLVAAGFVTLAVLGMARRLLPRFLRNPEIRFLFVVALPLTAVGPGLLAYGFSRSAFWFRVGAVCEAAGLMLFAVAALVMVLRARRLRSANIAYAASAASAVAAVALGLLFALEPTARPLAPLHATLNLLGFIGLIVVGATIDLYAPALGVGGSPVKRHARVVVGLTIVGLGLFLATWHTYPQVSTAGLGLYAGGFAWLVAGLWWGFARIVTVSRRRL